MGDLDPPEHPYYRGVGFTPGVPFIVPDDPRVIDHPQLQRGQTNMQPGTGPAPAADDPLATQEVAATPEQPPSAPAAVSVFESLADDHAIHPPEVIPTPVGKLAIPPGMNQQTALDQLAPFIQAIAGAQPAELLHAGDRLVGMWVHYVLLNKEHRPAVVVRNWARADLEETVGMVNLVVVLDGSNDHEATMGYADATKLLQHLGSIRYNPEKLPGSWHFISDD